MGMFDKVKKTTINSRLYEEKLYEAALEEVESGEIRKGLYAKALSKAEGDKEKADGIYLKLRVQSIMDDIETQQITIRENAKSYEALQEAKKIEATTIKTNKSKAAKNNKLSKYSIDGIQFRTKIDFDAYTKGLEKAASKSSSEDKYSLKKRIDSSIKAAEMENDENIDSSKLDSGDSSHQNKEIKYSLDGITFKTKKDFKAYIASHPQS